MINGYKLIEVEIGTILELKVLTVQFIDRSFSNTKFTKTLLNCVSERVLRPVWVKFFSLFALSMPTNLFWSGWNFQNRPFLFGLHYVALCVFGWSGILGQTIYLSYFGILECATYLVNQASWIGWRFLDGEEFCFSF